VSVEIHHIGVYTAALMKVRPERREQKLKRLYVGMAISRIGQLKQT